MSQNTANLLYLIPMAAFILALHFLSSPRHARFGNQIGAIGMLVAIVVTLFKEEVVTGWWIMLAGGIVGTVIGVVGARTVKMTAMPQMVALFNGVGGGAAALISVVEFHGVWRTSDTSAWSAGRDRVLCAHRLDLVRRLDGRVRKAPGAHLGAADHLSRHAVRQRRRLRRSDRRRNMGDGRRPLLGAGGDGRPGRLFGVLFVLPIGGADMPS